MLNYTFRKMAQNYIKKRAVNMELEERNIQEAINEVKDGKSVKKVAEDNGVKHTTLFYRIKKLKTPQGEWIPQKLLKFNSKYTVN